MAAAGALVACGGDGGRTIWHRQHQAKTSGPNWTTRSSMQTATPSNSGRCSPTSCARTGWPTTSPVCSKGCRSSRPGGATSRRRSACVPAPIDPCGGGTRRRTREIWPPPIFQSCSTGDWTSSGSISPSCTRRLGSCSPSSTTTIAVGARATASTATTQSCSSRMRTACCRSRSSPCTRPRRPSLNWTTLSGNWAFVR